MQLRDDCEEGVCAGHTAVGGRPHLHTGLQQVGSFFTGCAVQ